MLYGTLLISTILITILIHNSNSEDHDCKGVYTSSKKERFMRPGHLAGHWNFIAQVSTGRTRVQCAGLVLRNKSKRIFTGYWYMIHDSEINRSWLKAHLVRDTLTISFKNRWGTYDEGRPLIISTSDSNTEFVMKDSRINLYYILSKNSNATIELLTKYQALAKETGLVLTMLSETNCHHKIHRNTHEKVTSHV